MEISLFRLITRADSRITLDARYNTIKQFKFQNQNVDFDAGNGVSYF
jgi:hypothetical protein